MSVPNNGHGQPHERREASGPEREPTNFSYPLGDRPGAGRPEYNAAGAQRAFLPTAARPSSLSFGLGMRSEQVAQAGHTATDADGALRDAVRRAGHRACNLRSTAGMAAFPMMEMIHVA
jgi:hypothetical protein